MNGETISVSSPHFKLKATMSLKSIQEREYYLTYRMLVQWVT